MVRSFFNGPINSTKYKSQLSQKACHKVFSKDTYSNEQRYLFCVYFYTFFSNTIPYNRVGYVENINHVIISPKIL